MTAALVNRLRDIGIVLSLDGSRLRVDSKSGTLTEPIRNLIRTNRSELIIALTPECAADDGEEIDAMCPLCEQASIVEDKSGRVCYRKSCGWREKPMGRMDKPPCWPDVEPSAALLMPGPEPPEIPIAGPVCPVCALPVDAPVPCSHLCQLRNDAAQFVEQWRAGKPAKSLRQTAGKPSSTWQNPHQ